MRSNLIACDSNGLRAGRTHRVDHSAM